MPYGHLLIIYPYRPRGVIELLLTLPLLLSQHLTFVERQKMDVFAGKDGSEPLEISSKDLLTKMGWLHFNPLSSLPVHLMIKRKTSYAHVVQPLIPALGRQRQAEGSLVYRMSSRTASTTGKKPVLTSH